MLSITEIEQINQKLNPELALSLSLDNAKRMESSLLHSGFSPSTDTVSYTHLTLPTIA